MFGKISRGFLAVSVAVVVAGCSSSSPTEGLSLTAQPSPADQQAASPAVVQALCPPVVMLEQTAVQRVYARGGDNNPDKLLYQASLADVTRQCTANETTMTIRIVAQGRIVQGPAGAPGKVTLPILVDVIDGENVIYTQKVAYPVDVPVGGAQFIFDKADIQIPNAQGGASKFTRVRLGFDSGTPAKRPARRG